MILAARARWVALARATRDAWVRAFGDRAGAVSSLGAGFADFGASRLRGRSTTGAACGFPAFVTGGALAGFGARTGAACVATVPVAAAPCSCGARTSVAPVGLAVVCDRRAAFAWRVAVDFFAMLFS